jgi:hypothetical protein
MRGEGRLLRRFGFPLGKNKSNSEDAGLDAADRMSASVSDSELTGGYDSGLQMQADGKSAESRRKASANMNRLSGSSSALLDPGRPVYSENMRENLYEPVYDDNMPPPSAIDFLRSSRRLAEESGTKRSVA